ncbi:MAG: radical SAM protein [Acidithiobacillus ferrivorans]|uniref:Radical SAM protein n=1 Tax=Acidithiobacillus ferrivorans TaxID=160808 RepID=A0A257T9E4_9PROT|nr:MAG: radical SAM protein [Acidithiobacillus ferrivorans]
MNPWLNAVSQVEALEDLVLNADLVDSMRERWSGLSGSQVGRINFYTPSFKHHETSEVSACGKNAFPAISITGGDCKLQCDHCKAKILEPMIPVRTPEELDRLVDQIVLDGGRGLLLSGGSDHQNVVHYEPYFPMLRKIKDRYPNLQIAMHTGIATPEFARGMEDAGVDVAMMDVIGAQDTINQVYHLRRSVDDFEAALEALVATKMKVVPHIVIGLHYGELLGEWNALEIIRRHLPSALVLVVIMSQYASSSRPFATPATEEIGKFFMDARAALPETPVLLGCARPSGVHRSITDTYAVMAGLNGVAFPSDGMLALAKHLDRDVFVTPSCCSMIVGEEVLALGDETTTIPLDYVPVAPKRRTQLRDIPIVFTA